MNRCRLSSNIKKAGRKLLICQAVQSAIGLKPDELEIGILISALSKTLELQTTLQGLEAYVLFVVSNERLSVTCYSTNKEHRLVISQKSRGRQSGFIDCP